MSRKRLEVEQIKITSTTPPADRGFYKKSRTAHGLVGDLYRRDPVTGEESSFVTAQTDPLTGGIELSVGREAVEHTLAQGEYADQLFSPDDWTLTTTGVVAAQRGHLSVVDILSGTGVTLTLRDSPDTAYGRQIWALPATNGPRRFEFPKPLPFHNGIHATVGGTTPVVKFILAGSE